VNYAPIRKFRLLANGPRVSPKPAACVLKEVSVTAYHGAAARIHDKQILTAAAGILGVEAYRASGVRLR
jgi:hypothetical protein